MKKITFWILLIAFLEGVTSLGIELYALRITNLYVGYSTATTGIILAMVLLACALGYWFGGTYATKILRKHQKTDSLLINASWLFMSSTIIYSFMFTIQTELLNMMIINLLNPLVVALIIGSLYGIGVFFGCCSIPLLTEYLNSNSEQNNVAGKYAGMMVGITTLGSVIGSTVVPMLSIPILGLNVTVHLLIAIILCASVIANVLAKKSGSPWILLLAGVILIAVTFTLQSKEENSQIVSTQANDWIIQKDIYGSNVNIMSNTFNGVQSIWDPAEKKDYAQYNVTAAKIMSELPINSLNVVGGAGMTMPYLMAKNNSAMKVDVIEIDNEIKPITEHYLQDKLPNNINVHFIDGNIYFKLKNTPNYDMTFIDSFIGLHVAPAIFNLETLKNIKRHSDKVMANIIVDMSRGNAYTQVILNTWQAVFPDAYLLDFERVDNSANGMRNFILCSFACHEQAVKLINSQYFLQNSDWINREMRPVLEYHALLN